MAIPSGFVAFGVALAITALPVSAAGSGQFNGLLNKLKQSTQQADSSQLGSNLPTSDIAAGLKEALAKGATDAINSLGRNGGFWNNPNVRIPLPGKLEQAGKLARQLGQGAKVEAFELSMNLSRGESGTAGSTNFRRCDPQDDVERCARHPHRRRACGD